MNSPRLRTREAYDDYSAPAPARRPKRSALRRHWLTGAFVCLLMGVVTYTGLNFYQTELRLQQVRETSQQLDDQLEAARRKNKDLEDKLNKMTSDQYMEYLAKSMGYIYPGETVYQKGTGKGN